MPTYEYECRSCGFSFERIQSMSEEAVRDCPKCGKDVRRLIFGGAGVIFKGSGFYVNDSRGKNPASPAASPQASPQATPQAEPKTGGERKAASPAPAAANKESA